MTKIGQFKDTKQRRIFLYALLDTGGHTKECRHCGERVTDLTEHCLAECKAMEQSRCRLKLVMQFYKVSEETKFDHKDKVFKFRVSKNPPPKTTYFLWGLGILGAAPKTGF